MGNVFTTPTEQLAVAGISFGAFIIGIFVSIAFYFFLIHKTPPDEVLKRALSIAKSSAKSVDYLPAIVLFTITILFTGGISWITSNQLVNTDTNAKKWGIQNMIGVSWALFIIAAVLIPTSLSSANISPDSKYYLVAALFTLYFTTLIAEIVFLNKLMDLPNSVDHLNTNDTRNMQGGLLAGVVAYGIVGLLML